MRDSDRLEIAERDARRANARFAALLDAAVNAIIVIDKTGHIEVFSRAAMEMFGYSSEEMLGKNVSALMPAPYRQDHDRYIKNYLATGKARIIGIGREVVATRKDGSMFPIELSVGEVHDGTEPRFVGIIRDISVRKIVETEMRQQRDKLAHVTRLSTMGEMAAGIAHEVNQPLTAIAAYSNACRRMIGAKSPDPEEIGILLDKISTQAMRAGEVIRRLRGFVKKHEGELEIYSVNELVREVAALAEVDAHNRGIELGMDLADEELPVLIDPVQIQQVLLNLVRNSIDALEPDHNHDQPVMIRSFRDEQMVMLEVIDSGHGIDEAVRDKLFTPFMTTKSSGMGLGLSISRSIINAHKGALLFRENPRGGSIFYFNLPIAEGELHK